jgi:hypothetical protein
MPCKERPAMLEVNNLKSGDNDATKRLLGLANQEIALFDEQSARPERSVSQGRT